MESRASSNPEQPTHPQSPPPLPAGAAPEFIDEAPGTYLSELRSRGLQVVWAAANLILVALMALIARQMALAPDSQWHVLARLLWILLPVSTTVAFTVALWQLPLANSRRSLTWSLLTLCLSLLGGGLWLYCRLVLGILAGT